MIRITDKVRQRLTSLSVRIARQSNTVIRDANLIQLDFVAWEATMHRVTALFAVLFTFIFTTTATTTADELQRALERIDALEQQVDELRQPADSSEVLQASISEPDQTEWTSRYYVDYDNGLVLRPVDKEATPFELKVRARMQFRYVGFNRDRTTFSNQGDLNRGGPLSISNRNDFEIERSRLIFTGFMYDPNLKFFLNLDADTDDNHRVRLHDFWVYYEFSESFVLNIGKAMVPGSRDWLSLSPNTHLADRSMATTFFRPGRTVGVWARGKLTDDSFYHVLVGNGFNTTDQTQADIDERFVYSATHWWEPLGEVGKLHSDLSFHESPVVRLGHSFTYASQTAQDNGTTNAEQNFVRLSDGTRLVTPSALAPGVTVNDFDVYLYAVDAAYKYRGFSANTEVFVRWLNSFESTGGNVPHQELFDRGFFVDAGYFLVPKYFEVATQVSHVAGLFGHSWEYAAGINVFLKGTKFNKLTFDVSVLDGSPAQNAATNHFIGQDGVMFRGQYQVQF